MEQVGQPAREVTATFATLAAHFYGRPRLDVATKWTTQPKIPPTPRPSEMLQRRCHVRARSAEYRVALSAGTPTRGSIAVAREKKANTVTKATSTAAQKITSCQRLKLFEPWA